MDVYAIIKRPLVTEKGTWQSQQAFKNRGGAYAFEVHPDANKHQIKDAVEQLFSVDVLGVRTMRMHRKTRRVGKFVGRKPEWKKAIVILAEGQSIEFFEGV